VPTVRPLERHVTGKINKLTIALNPPKLTPEDEKKVSDAYRAARDAH
jgi:arylsulfatase